jgi:hypothetical protein
MTIIALGQRDSRIVDGNAIDVTPRSPRANHVIATHTILCIATKPTQPTKAGNSRGKIVEPK